MLTIKQLADKLGVSKPTITRNKPEHAEFTVIDGVNYINDTLEQQITEKVLQNKTRYSSDTSTETNDSTLVQQLLQENAFLRAQIEEKDALLKTQAKLLDQQQQLNLVTGQRLNELESSSEESTEVEKESAPEKKGLFKRWFGQNK
ncbi:TPA: hypothetical protein O2C19_002850 [Staphylococcus aureus]|jgi:predicted transcriptional regulator|uniref:hypothetical protein n=1 Tax=Staphylococcus TaxID=1279 RepID=UPI0007CA70CD|nr:MULTISPECIES: hypothetical protein [Staphylococcus]MDW4108231.1 hypothetical protein [Staphylococcus saprophyticus]MBF2179332.1 hypothetical protein [Staphylococcus warneri]MBF2186246.1 hypothetical protein [Staphylococcus warneri]MDU9840824.1 hypothetical protein [Staphylococcus aureus]MDV0014251.1 hypothetical protein [Staphylococcus aureus]